MVNNDTLYLHYNHLNNTTMTTSITTHMESKAVKMYSFLRENGLSHEDAKKETFNIIQEAVASVCNL
jgi:hypothetical protein